MKREKGRGIWRAKRGEGRERENNFHVIQRSENDQLNVWASSDAAISPLYAKIFRRISAAAEFVKRENSISVTVRAKSSVYPESGCRNRIEHQ